MRPVALLVVLVLEVAVSLPKGAAAQIHTLASGQEVRIAHECRIPHTQAVDCRPGLTQRVDTGHLAVIDADTIRLQRQWSDVVLAIPTSAVSAMWVRERRGHTLQGAGLGMLAGTIIGGIVGSGLELCVMSCPSGAPRIGPIVGEAFGLLLGSLVGSMIRSDRWEEIPLDRLRLNVVPHWGGFGLGAGIAF